MVMSSHEMRVEDAEEGVGLVGPAAPREPDAAADDGRAPRHHVAWLLGVAVAAWTANTLQLSNNCKSDHGTEELAGAVVAINGLLAYAIRPAAGCRTLVIFLLVYLQLLLLKKAIDTTVQPLHFVLMVVSSALAAVASLTVLAFPVASRLLELSASVPERACLVARGSLACLTALQLASLKEIDCFFLIQSHAVRQDPLTGAFMLWLWSMMCDLSDGATGTRLWGFRLSEYAEMHGWASRSKA